MVETARNRRIEAVSLSSRGPPSARPRGRLRFRVSRPGHHDPGRHGNLERAVAGSHDPAGDRGCAVKGLGAQQYAQGACKWHAQRTRHLAAISFIDE